MANKNGGEGASAMLRSFADSFFKPKKKYSLENFKYLYQQLVKNPTVDESNQVLMVETLRSIAELLIWGDQNETKFFDFFFEKNIHSYFLKILQQKTNPTITVQLLQTLSILFENIKTETSIYYLLSNNYVNQIICHKFDISNEEILAYYISFLKTLSLKLNKNTIHFFFNEHLNDFPLYTEAIKFFNHEESMIRIAVRTLTLNVYKVDDERMLRFILDRTAVPYFSNLSYFIGDQSISLNDHILSSSPSKKGKLEDLIAEQIDVLYYLNDIFSLKVPQISDVLEAQLVKKLFIPLYVHSLVPEKVSTEETRISPLVGLFLLSQVMCVFQYKPIMSTLAAVLMNKDRSFYDSLIEEFKNESSEISLKTYHSFYEENIISSPPISYLTDSPRKPKKLQEQQNTNNFRSMTDSDFVNIKNKESVEKATKVGLKVDPNENENKNNFFQDAIMQYLNSKDTDLLSLPAICLIHMIIKNPNINPLILENCGLSPRRLLKTRALLRALTDNEKTPSKVEKKSKNHRRNISEGSTFRVQDEKEDKEEKVVEQSRTIEKSNSMSDISNLILPEEVDTNYDDLVEIVIEKLLLHFSKCRPVTILVSMSVIQELVYLNSTETCLTTIHENSLRDLENKSKSVVRKYSENPPDFFLEMFEDEIHYVENVKFKVEKLMTDTSIFFIPSQTPLTGIDFSMRLPCGDAEKSQKAIRDFLLIRKLRMKLMNMVDVNLPLAEPLIPIMLNDVIDLTNSDMISCTVIDSSGFRLTRFLVFDEFRLILVEPDTTKIGWGIVRFIATIQHVQVEESKTDDKTLEVTCQIPTYGGKFTKWTSKFSFVDYVRCIAAKQHLERSRSNLRNTKLKKIRNMISDEP